jgi:hypothetical protein
LKASVAQYAVVLAFVTQAACFKYVPVELSAVPPGKDVRVYVTREAMAELGDAADPSAPILNGTLVRREPDRLVMRVPVTSRQVGFFTEQIGQEVSVRTNQIVQFEERRLDRVGTGLLVAGTAVAAAGVIFLIIEASGGTDPVEPPPDELRVPIFTISIR